MGGELYSTCTAPTDEAAEELGDLEVREVALPLFTARLRRVARAARADERLQRRAVQAPVRQLLVHPLRRVIVIIVRSTHLDN